MSSRVTEANDLRYIPYRRKCHEGVIRRFRAIVEENLVWPLSIGETAGRIGISGRSLRVICQEQLGLSPAQYWLYRRMELAHRTLIAGDRSVTDVATLWGFWELGRFSGMYRKIYGEPPSATRKRFSSFSAGPLLLAMSNNNKATGL
jgi:transcriptional regulator GlxA family with amidase domain